ncbi:metallo-beta-lactamase domain protein [Colletotrichum incanum]|uniref:Metallo-beta-lactamase domain protein n=1 Tax=Colletotrichum incanum TaxID=1573173 RepID=A0A166LAM0_COLIC|nr:metallo-beta-lactamase domain protein [Colletotrichum incanum]
MPLWTFSHSAGAFTAEEKRDLAEAITKLYTDVGLPAFYVNVQFISLGEDDIWYGAKPHPKFTMVSIVHVAQNVQTHPDKAKKAFISAVDNILTPRMTKKGMGWEYYVMEGPREFWKIDGIVPPPTGSEMEKLWAQHNRPVLSESKL